MVAANLSDRLELADGESGAAAVSVVVGKRKTNADPAKPADAANPANPADAADPAGQDKAALKPYTELKTDDPVVVGKKNTDAVPSKLADAADPEPDKLADAAAPTPTRAKLPDAADTADEDRDALNPYTELQHDNNDGVRLRVKEQGKSGFHLKESPKEHKKLRMGHAILVPCKRERWIPLEDDKERPTDNCLGDSGSNLNNVNENLYSKGGFYDYSDYCGNDDQHQTQVGDDIEHHIKGNEDGQLERGHDCTRVGGRQCYFGEDRVKEKSFSDAATKAERKVFSDFGTDAEKVVPANQTDQKNANAYSPVPASESAHISATLNAVGITMPPLDKAALKPYTELKTDDPVGSGKNTDADPSKLADSTDPEPDKLADAATPTPTLAAGREAEKVVSANRTEQKNGNAESAAPASESAGFSASLNTGITTGTPTEEKGPYCLENASTDRQLVSCEHERAEPKDLELDYHKIYLQELVLKKEHLDQQLELAEKQLNMAKAENKRLIKANKKLQSLHDFCSYESGITSKKVLDKLAYFHNIFLCSNEIGVQLEDYISDSHLKLLCTTMIPGATSTDPVFKFRKLKKMTPFCKVSFLGMIERVYRLHQEGLSLGGKFSLKDFFWTLDQKVKFGASVKRFVSSRNRKKIKLDYRRLYKVMMELLKGCGLHIPADLQYLFDLMRSSNVLQALIRYNFCLMDEISKREYTITLFTEVQKLDKEDSEKFKKLTKKDYRSASAQKFISVPADWSNSMCSNRFVKKVYEKMMVDKGSHGIVKNEFVKFIRHCLVHLPDYAYDEYKKIHFDDTLVVDLVEVHAPGVFGQFQKGMHCINKAAYPHLIRIMRA